MLSIWTSLKICNFTESVNIMEKDENVSNITENEQNARYQYFILFPQCCLTAPFPGSLKLGIVLQ